MPLPHFQTYSVVFPVITLYWTTRTDAAASARAGIHPFDRFTTMVMDISNFGLAFVREYVERCSHAAFAQIEERHQSSVYSTFLREVTQYRAGRGYDHYPRGVRIGLEIECGIINIGVS